MFIQKMGEVTELLHRNGKIIEKYYPNIILEAESEEDEAKIIEIIKKYSK